MTGVIKLGFIDFTFNLWPAFSDAVIHQTDAVFEEICRSDQVDLAQSCQFFADSREFADNEISESLIAHIPMFEFLGSFKFISDLAKQMFKWQS